MVTIKYVGGRERVRLGRKVQIELISFGFSSLLVCKGGSGNRKRLHMIIIVLSVEV